MSKFIWSIVALIIAAITAALHEMYKDDSNIVVLAIEIFAAIEIFMVCFTAFHGL